MPYQNRRLNLECVENLENVICQPLVGIARLGVTGRPKSPPRDGIDVAAIGQLGGEVVVDVRRVPRTSQQHDGPSGSAPIEYLQLHVLFDGDEMDLVFRWVLPRCGLLRTRRPYQQSR
jgi:hypothetical protein